MESIGLIENGLFGKELLMLPARKKTFTNDATIFSVASFVRRLRLRLVNKIFANDAAMFSAHHLSVA